MDLSYSQAYVCGEVCWAKRCPGTDEVTGALCYLVYDELTATATASYPIDCETHCAVVICDVFVVSFGVTTGTKLVGDCVGSHDESLHPIQLLIRSVYHISYLLSTPQTSRNITC